VLFEETLNSHKDEVEAAVDQLYEKAFQNQVCKTDLLLVLENGLKKDYNQATLSRLKISPYQIGPDFIGFRYDTFYHFINHYRQGIRPKSEFLKEFTDERLKESFLDFYRDFQLLLYMKFWETDLILRRLSNLSNLAQGLSYYWEYSQDVFNRRRNLIQNDIKNPLTSICPLFSALINDIYFNQIRNAVAHSQYYFLHNSINFTNKAENRHYTLNNISYENWEVMFSKVILLYNYLIKNHNEYNKKYQEEVEGKKFGLLVNFPEINNKGIQKTGWLKFDFSQKRWYWNQ